MREFTDQELIRREKAEKLKEMFLSRGYKLFLDSPTNQQFIILENSKMEELKKNMKTKN